MWSISRPDVLRGDYSPVSTTRVDGWPVSITHQHGPLTRVVETGLMYGLIRFSLLGYLCLSWVLWVCSVSTIAKWLAGKSRLWMVCYVSSRMLNSSHLPTRFLLIYICPSMCVCVQLLRHDPAQRLPLLYVMNHPWIKSNVVIEPLSNSLAGQGLASLPLSQQLQQNKWPLSTRYWQYHSALDSFTQLTFACALHIFTSANSDIP